MVVLLFLSVLLLFHSTKKWWMFWPNILVYFPNHEKPTHENHVFGLKIGTDLTNNNDSSGGADRGEGSARPKGPQCLTKKIIE